MSLRRSTKSTEVIGSHYKFEVDVTCDENGCRATDIENMNTVGYLYTAALQSVFGPSATIRNAHNLGSNVEANNMWRRAIQPCRFFTNSQGQHQCVVFPSTPRTYASPVLVEFDKKKVHNVFKPDLNHALFTKEESSQKIPWTDDEKNKTWTWGNQSMVVKEETFVPFLYYS